MASSEGLEHAPNIWATDTSTWSDMGMNWPSSDGVRFSTNALLSQPATCQLSDATRSAGDDELVWLMLRSITEQDTHGIRLELSNKLPLHPQYAVNEQEKSEIQASMALALLFLQQMVQNYTIEFAARRKRPTRATPKFPVKSQIYTLIEFKRGRIALYESAIHAAPGEHVIVEGDQGEDLGMVVMTWSTPKFLPTIGNQNGVPLPNLLRRASPKAVTYCHRVLGDLENQCIEYCRRKVSEFGLEMVIVDAEYQFDRRKVTFYYVAADWQDFRDLIRDLFKTFRARIWMTRVDSRETTAMKDRELRLRCIECLYQVCHL